MSKQLADLREPRTAPHEIGRQAVAEQMRASAGGLESRARNGASHDGADRAGARDPVTRGPGAEEQTARCATLAITTEVVDYGIAHVDRQREAVMIATR
jgi:hypothetical protein